MVITPTPPITPNRPYRLSEPTKSRPEVYHPRSSLAPTTITPSFRAVPTITIHTVSPRSKTRCRSDSAAKEHHVERTKSISSPLTPKSEMSVRPIRRSNAMACGTSVRRRLILVNPSMAVHLQRGGSVTVRSEDGAKWRVYLPTHARAI